MTSMTSYRPWAGSWTAPTLRNALVVRQGIAWTTYVDTFALIVRPVVVTLGIAAAAVMWPAHGPDAPITSAVSGGGGSPTAATVTP
jgi:hypothetical protein